MLRAYAAQHTVMENANALAAKAIRTCGGQAMLKSLPLERIYRDSRCGSLMLPWTAEICLDRLGRETLYEPGEKDESDGLCAMDLSDLIDRNAAFAPDKPAIRFGGATLTYAAFAAAHRRGGARAEIAARRRARRPRRDPLRSIIPTIWCCSMPARGSARCWCRSTGGSPCPSRCSSCAMRR